MATNLNDTTPASPAGETNAKWQTDGSGNDSVYWPQAPIQKQSATYAADSGAANAYVVTLSPVPASYTTGMRVCFKAANTNSGASTINVNSLGPKNITKAVATALASGDITAGQIVIVVYDGTEFQMTSWTGASGGGASPIATPFLRYNGSGTNLNAFSAFVANTIQTVSLNVPFEITFSHLEVSCSFDPTNNYDFGIYDTSGNLLAHVGPVHLAGGGGTFFSVIGAPITLPAGNYIFAFTCDAASGATLYLGRDNAGAGLPYYAFSSATTSSGGTLPSTITPPTVAHGQNFAYNPVVVLY